MRWPSILIVTGTLLLLVAKQEVQARNYLWWTLGLEEESHDRRILAKRNVKAHARIADSRQQKREARHELGTVDAPVVGKRFDKKAASDTTSMVQMEDADSSETEVSNKKSQNVGHNLLRAKVVKAVSAQRESGYVQPAQGESSYVRPEGNSRPRDNGKAKAISATNNSGSQPQQNKHARPAQVEVDEIATQNDGEDAGVREKAGGKKTRAHERLERNEANKRQERNAENRASEHEANKEVGVAGGKKTRAHERLERNEANKRQERNAENRASEHDANKEVGVADSTSVKVGVADVTPTAGESPVEASAEGGGTQRRHKNLATKRLKRFEEKKRQAKNEYKRTVDRQEKRAEVSAQIEHVTLQDGGSDETALFVGTDTTGVVTPVVSLYWGIFNNPDACPQQPCKLEDALDPYTKASLLHGTAGFPDAFGKVTLVSSIYRTPEYSDYSGTALLDGLALKTGGAFRSAGFYNNEAEVLVAIRKVVSAESDTMAKVLESTEFSDSLNLSDDFVQVATFKSGQSGFEVVYSVGSGDVVAGAQAHLTRQNDVMQIYLETNVNDYNIS
jgi:hypothetical protein